MMMIIASSSSGANPTLGHGCPNESTPDSPILRSVPGGEKANVGWFNYDDDDGDDDDDHCKLM